jgi:hypothetical protein
MTNAAAHILGSEIHFFTTDSIPQIFEKAIKTVSKPPICRNLRPAAPAAAAPVRPPEKSFVRYKETKCKIYLTKCKASGKMAPEQRRRNF